MSLDLGIFLTAWVEKYQPDPKTFKDLIDSGLRTDVPTEGPIKYSPDSSEPIRPYSNIPTATCQYWVPGLPCVCDYWSEGKCTYGEGDEDLVKPTGYNEGMCDGIGRRAWCDKHTVDGKTKLDGPLPYDTKPACVAPCPERSGMGKQITTIPYTCFRPYTVDEVRGYNKDEEDLQWKGRCDGLGMGRGTYGFGVETIEDMYLILPVCNLYRPNIMSFGSVTPRPIPDSLDNIHDGTSSDPLVPMEKRLPFIFQMYNIRARAQKCVYWVSDFNTDFFIDDYGSSVSDFTINCDSGYCTCTDDKAKPFRDVTENWVEGLPFTLQDVWADYGGVVCNGAKPECPCYSGKWIYCTDGNTKDGMRITADQIHELRFWTSNWASQEEYDSFYAQKPGVTHDGFADETTADIYTFTHWLKLGPTPSESQMQGQKHHLCMPVPIHEREFDPSVYITKTSVVYPTHEELKGTHGPGDVAYPTLVRELHDGFSDILPDILLMYPYPATDPFSIVPCEKAETTNICVHDTNLEDAPGVQAIGHTVSDCTIYVINATDMSKSNPALVYMNTYVRANSIPSEQIDDFNTSVSNLLKNVQVEDIKSSVGDYPIFKVGLSNEVGFFNIGPTKLKHNTTNILYIICDYTGGGEYVYRKTQVQSRYWAGLIKQNSFFQEGQAINSSTSFSPAAEVDGRTICLRSEGELKTIFPVYSFYRYNLMGNTAFYGYCINKYEKEIEDIPFWAQIGPSGYVWAEIPDPDISYLFDFSITSATMSYVGKAEKSSCSNQDLDNILLEVVLPISSDGPTSTYRRSIPPNAVLLKSSTPMGFFNSEWQLKIKYAYFKLEPNKGDSDNPEFSETVWPANIDSPLSGVKFSSSPYKVTEGDNSFKVSDITHGTVAVMAYFSDENGRVQCAAATKMLLYGHQLSCRSVDIFYNYTAGTSQGYSLHPQYMWWTGESPTIRPDSFSMSNWSTPRCGDHECHTASCQGPMWYPFNSCLNSDYYNVQNGAASCTSRIVAGDDQINEKGAGMWRYRSIDLFKASVADSYTHFYDCGTQWRYYYAAYNTDDRFNGWGNIKGPVNEPEYNYRGWSLPPFGNSGREFVERYLLKDYCSFFTLTSNGFVSGNEYMPYVFDVPDLITDLNCFANYSNSSGLFEPFTCLPQLSLNLSGQIEEVVLPERYRFDEVIEHVTHVESMYPHPVQGSSGFPIVKRLSFKAIDGLDNVSWAWPEFWRFIERTSDTSSDSEDGQLEFASYSRPEYIFDLNKEEHRLITDEGENFIIFTPPKKATKEEPPVYASISLGVTYERYFQITYEDYNTSGNVLWKDESAEGEVGGSGGAETSIYYDANNYVDKEGDGDGEEKTDPIWWIHDYNTLFDGYASRTPSEDRKALMGYDEAGEKVYGYYNQGIIANIFKSSLQYLPVTNEQLTDYTTIDPEDYSYDSEEVISKVTYMWSGEEEEDQDTFGIFEKTPLKVIIEGFYGTKTVTGDGGFNTDVYCLPSVSYKEVAMYLGDNVDLITYEYKDEETIATTTFVSGLHLTPTTEGVVDTFQPFTIEIDLYRTPQRMLSNFLSFKVELNNFPGEKMYIESVKLYGGEYEQIIEAIRVWERKYNISTGSVLDDTEIQNADGVDSVSYRRPPLSSKNSGQYFPFGSNVLEEGGTTMSKMTTAVMGKLSTEDKSLSITKDNLTTIEKEEQKKLYDTAFELEDYNVISFNSFLPPGISGFLNYINSSPLSLQGFLSLTQNKIPWELHPLYAGYKEGTFFYPGGHRWEWGLGREMECWLCAKFVADIYEGVWVHVNHGGSSIAVASAMYSFAGFGRLEYYEGRLSSLDAMGLIEWDAPTDGLTGAINGEFFRHDPE